MRHDIDIIRPRPVFVEGASATDVRVPGASTPLALESRASRVPAEFGHRLAVHVGGEVTEAASCAHVRPLVVDGLVADLEVDIEL